MSVSARLCPALFVSAPGSNHGKTTVTAAVARFLAQQLGIPVLVVIDASGVAQTLGVKGKSKPARAFHYPDPR